MSLVGSGGLGALSYQPDETTETNSLTDLNDAMRFAGAVIEESAETLPGSKALQEAGSNPGGRYPKILVGWKEDSERLMIGSRDFTEGYIPCIMKLDMGNRLPVHLRDLCQKEHHLLSAAQQSGIDTPEHWLIRGENNETGGYANLVVKRFDRKGSQRIHTHTFGGLTHQLAVRYGSSYEDLLRTTLALTKDHRQVTQQYRRMVFNVACGNRDDHVRNHSFIFDKTKGWALSPAYDLTPTPENTEHALSVNSKWNSIADSDLIKVAELFSIERPRDIIEQSRSAIAAIRNSER